MNPLPSLTSLKHSSKNNVKKDKNYIYLFNGCEIIINTSHPFIKSILKRDPDSFNSSETTLSQENSYRNRLKTFDGVWRLDFISPEQMANAGFYFTGKEDRVRCLDCSQEFDYWCYGDSPLVEHKKKSPMCRFFTENKGYDVCGLYGSPPAAEISNNITNLEIEDYLYSSGAVRKLETPKHKEYASFETRLQTFNNCQLHLKQNIHTLSEAGLFYAGNGFNDQMLCFYCGQDLRGWEINDEPWTEHARWSPTCTFILLSKGKDFVDQCVGRVSKNNQEELSKLATDHEDASMPKNEMKDDSMINKIDNLEITEKSQIKTSSSAETLHLSQQNLNTIPDSTACKICFKAEVMVAFLPCGHVTACVQCALALDYCAICRQPFKSIMKVQVYQDESKDEDIDHSPCNSSQSSQVDCNNCHKKEMDAVFIPCGHIYNCVDCATAVKDCPVCSKTFIACMNVYL